MKCEGKADADAFTIMKLMGHSAITISEPETAERRLDSWTTEVSGSTARQ